MTVFSLVPSGFYQFYYAVKYGMWYARSPEITSGPTMQFFSYMRIVPDLIFISGAILIFAFMIRGVLLTFGSGRERGR